MDGDPATAWTTERYGRSSNFNGRKPGAGVIVDLGQPNRVGWVTVVLGAGATAGEIRVPTDTAATAPPLTSAAAWRTVATIPPSAGEVSVRVEPAASTRFVLVYLTSLPKEGANYVGAIHEVRVTP